MILLMRNLQPFQNRMVAGIEGDSNLGKLPLGDRVLDHLAIRTHIAQPIGLFTDRALFLGIE